MIPARFAFPSPGFSWYWQQASGRKMLKKLGRTPLEEEIAQNIPLLFQVDELADRVVEEVYEKLGFQPANALLEQFFHQGLMAKTDFPASMAALFAEVDAAPLWLDYDLLEEGAAFCRRAGALALIVLRNFCLMGGYESSAINKPLIFTGALKKGAAKRMAETIEFWVNVTGKNAMQRGGIGFQSALKVRLMHAWARVSIRRMPEWQNQIWGHPLNQWDMLATNLGFSLVFMDGLQKLGFRPTEREFLGVLHLWKYLGFLMGIPPKILPDTEKQAISALYQWTMSQAPADGDTRALAAALLNEPLKASYPSRNWQKKLLIQTHLSYNHFFLGEKSCQTMGLPPTPLKWYPYPVAAINRGVELLVQSSPRVYQKLENLGRKQQENLKTLFLRSHGKV